MQGFFKLRKNLQICGLNCLHSLYNRWKRIFENICLVDRSICFNIKWTEGVNWSNYDCLNHDCLNHEWSMKMNDWLNHDWPKLKNKNNFDQSRIWLVATTGHKWITARITINPNKKNLQKSAADVEKKLSTDMYCWCGMKKQVRSFIP